MNKLRKNLSRRLQGYFVPFFTNKWEVHVRIKLNVIFGCGAVIHSAIPCSQCNIVHCNFCPGTAQLCRAGKMSQARGEHRGSTRAYAIRSSLCALVQWTCPIQLMCMGVCCWSVARASPSPCAVPCAHTCSSLTTKIPFVGAVGCPEAVLETMLQPGLSKDRGQVVESHRNNRPRRQKRIRAKKTQTQPWVYLVLLLLSSHCYCLIHHRHPLLLDEVSAFSSLSSLVNHSMCLPVMMPIFITPIWGKKNTHERRKRGKTVGKRL